MVITGSHNFSTSASAKNDENFIIIKGDAEFAEAYAVNILGAYAHYRWRAFLAADEQAFQRPEGQRQRGRPRCWRRTGGT